MCLALFFFPFWGEAEHPWIQYFFSLYPEERRAFSGSSLPPISWQDAGELPLHVAVRHADRSSLPLVDFIIQNGYVSKCSQCSLPLSLM